MNLLEAIDARHAIRAYTDEPVAPDTLAQLQAEIDACNAESGLHIQMVAGLDDAFLGLKTHYGRFKGVHNAIALIGAVAGGSTNGNDGEVAAEASAEADSRVNSQVNRDAAAIAAATPAALTTLQSFKDAEGTPVSPEAADLQERVGYYGERLVLRAVQLGLETSWAVLDGAESVDPAEAWWRLGDGESVVWVIAFGHGARLGGRRRTKPLEELASVVGDGISAADGPADAVAEAPGWFLAGMEAAMKAPTSLSQQPFHFTLHLGGPDDDPDGGEVSAEALEGLFAHVGLGCAKYHFEIGATPHKVKWR
ncbi:nitroreductase family protein [Bifidobacterium callitrichos]|uniref:Nitroreductase n=1 Tax=Bifidobacterium callitrichos DSM 23973 TaxID=1437609 RepID=A0A087A0R2_9BIFI|nr:nitroreductase family protein [Bifidobacterium callitrichos]KFI52362.1 nitroreductase [Bifidobacterium callitrichos DSM 23973]